MQKMNMKGKMSMERMTRIVLILVMIVLLIADSRAADVYPKGTYYIGGNGIWLRKTPSLDGTVVSLLYENKEDWITINGTRYNCCLYVELNGYK